MEFWAFFIDVAVIFFSDSVRDGFSKGKSREYGTAMEGKKTANVCPKCNQAIFPGTQECPCEALQSKEHRESSFFIPYRELKEQTLGPYKIVEIIGRGGMGCIYKALHTALFKPVALKVMFIDQASQRPNVERFIQEAQITARLKHPNIVTVHHAGCEKDVYYIAMDLVQGKTIAQLLDEKRLSTKESLEIIAEVAEGLQYAHEHKIVHRDIKPSNIMISANGRPIIMDFGLAKDMGFNASLTQAGNIVGSPYYMSPEQAQGKKVDPRSDIFSLGAVFYEMLTYKKPFEGDSSLEIIQEVVAKDPFPARKIAAHIHKDLETICMKCLEKLPSMRYQNVREVAEDIRSFLRGEAIRARRSSPFYKTTKWIARNKFASVTLAFACLFVLMTIVVAYRLYQEQTRAQKVQELTTHLQYHSLQIAKEIELAWLQTIKDGHILVNTHPLRQIMERADASPKMHEEGICVLKLWVEIKGYLEIFLLKADGVCILSTNPKFLGIDYTFRPYYRYAVKKEQNIFYAIGTQSKTPGYFCAVPSYSENRLTGVCVIKFDISSISRILKRKSFFKTEEIVLVDENGILIQSSRQDILLKCLKPLEKEILENIKESRQFLDHPLELVKFKGSFPVRWKENGLGKIMDERNQVRLAIFTPLSSFPYTILTMLEYRELERMAERF